MAAPVPQQTSSALAIGPPAAITSAIASRTGSGVRNGVKSNFGARRS